MLSLLLLAGARWPVRREWRLLARNVKLNRAGAAIAGGASSRRRSYLWSDDCVCRETSRSRTGPCSWQRSRRACEAPAGPRSNVETFAAIAKALGLPRECWDVRADRLVDELIAELTGRMQAAAGEEHACHAHAGLDRVVPGRGPHRPLEGQARVREALGRIVSAAAGLRDALASGRPGAVEQTAALPEARGD